jgi:nitrogen fixation NifU-like protein
VGALPPLLQEHFLHPRCVGAMPDANASGRAVNAACGDDLRIFLKIEGDRIARASFQARACSAVIAVASLAAEELRGASLESARALSCEELVARAGGLPRERAHAPRVAERAVREALRRFAGARGRSPGGGA